MNVLVWILQLLLAAHTAIGAVWKWSHSAAQTMPTLAAIPQPLWLAMGVVELLCVVALVVPRAALAPIAAAFVAAEMVLFTAVHLASGSRETGPVVYWLVVAAICAFVIYGRLVLAPAARRGSVAAERT